MIQIKDIVFDCHHAATVARFWAATLPAYEIAPYDEAELARLKALGINTPEDDPTVLVEGPPGTPRFFFQSVPEPKTRKNRVHLNLICDNLQPELKRLTNLGAKIITTKDTRTTLADPEGNEFSLQEQRQSPTPP
jgi:hypothetical protein